MERGTFYKCHEIQGVRINTTRAHKMVGWVDWRCTRWPHRLTPHLTQAYPPPTHTHNQTGKNRNHSRFVGERLPGPGLRLWFGLGLVLQG